MVRESRRYVTLRCHYSSRGLTHASGLFYKLGIRFKTTFRTRPRPLLFLFHGKHITLSSTLCIADYCIAFALCRRIYIINYSTTFTNTSPCGKTWINWANYFYSRSKLPLWLTVRLDSYRDQVTYHSTYERLRRTFSRKGDGLHSFSEPHFGVISRNMFLLRSCRQSAFVE